MLNDEIPDHQKIRIIIDNHSAHVSKETKTYLPSMPTRFEIVFTTKHGSLLILFRLHNYKI